MTSPYNGGTKPPTPDTNVEIGKIVSDVADGKQADDPIKVIVIKQEVEAKKTTYGTIYFMLGALFVAWCILGTIVKNWMLKSTTNDYINTKEVRNHPWISKLVLNQSQIQTSIAFTRQFEACENNSFLTAGWDALALYRAKKRLNYAMGLKTSGSNEVETVDSETSSHGPRGVVVTKVTSDYARNDIELRVGDIITYYNGVPINSTNDLRAAREAAVASGSFFQVRLTWHDGDQEYSTHINKGKIGISIENRD